MTHPDKYYSALKRNELSSHEKTWKKLKCILLSKKSKSEKATCHDFNPVTYEPVRGYIVKTAFKY